VFDKVVALRGPSVVALVTGEERIVPPRAAYWVCTVEAMPQGLGADFVAVDEIQLCADPERGHVFTDRLLNMRGQKETQFLGAHTMRDAISELVPEASFMGRERMSQLTYSGSKKLSKMPERSAIVGFSVDNVYAMAELLRRQKGGAAVVMGALSPRTRNAQVDLYQNGDVDYLVATDAIGMGLNLDINHVAFSSLIKFDGRRMRHLAPNELGQIAGRAGRGMSNGTFGVTGEAPDLPEDMAQAIMDHRFAPIRKLEWRNDRLRFGTLEALTASLEQKPDDTWLARARDADDLIALKMLAEQDNVRARASDGAAIRLLWDVCRVPDFRGISHAEHAALLERIFVDLHEHGRVEESWFAGQVARIDRTDGDIDTLSKRLAYIRTWTYVAQRKGWLSDEIHWRDATRAVEDRLSDALHGALTQRFVDRRTSVLMRRLKQKEAMVAEVNETGDVTVEGQFVGRLEGFRFQQDKTAGGQEAKAVQQASLQALVPHFHLRCDKFYNAPDTEIDFTEQGGLMWGEHAVGKLVAGSDALRPQVVAFVDDVAGPDVIAKVQRRLQHFIDRKIATLFEPLIALQRDEALTGLARGFGFQLVENFGVIPRADVADDVKALDQEARGQLRKHGVRFGQFTIFLPLLLKPAPTRLRLVLWALAKGLDEFPESPPAGLVTVPVGRELPAGYHSMAGYRAAGERAIRIDMLERLADLVRAEDSRKGFEASADMLSITGMTLAQFAVLMEGLGYRAEKGEREKVRAAPVEPTAASGEAPDTARTEGAEAGSVDETAPETTIEPDVGAPASSDHTDDSVQKVSVDAPPAAEAVKTGVETDLESSAGPEAAGQETPPSETASEIAVPEATAPADSPEVDVFYTFTWAGRGAQQRQEGRGKARSGGKQQAKAGKPGGPRKGGRRQGGKAQPGKQATGSKTFSAKPAKAAKIDPDNPFAAALMGLRDKI
ncbi:MAG: helicase-related protein, partial [Pseudomonadota bacterium]